MKVASTVLLFLIWTLIGFTWLTCGEYEPIHERLAGQEWEELSEGMQDLIIMLMRLMGGSCMGIGVMMLFLLFSPLNKSKWANLCLLVVNVIALAPIVYMNIKFKFFRDYGIVEPNWILASASVVIAIIGYVLGLFAAKSKKDQ